MNAFLAGLVLGMGFLTAQEHSAVSTAPFGKTAAGEAVEAYTLRDAAGLELTVMSYGATVLSLLAPDRSGAKADVVLGFDRLSDYEERKFYFGGVIGRFANRIANARFDLDGQTFPLTQNLPPDNLHGGTAGFDSRVWSATILSEDPPSVRFHRVSKDGEEGFPGNLSASVTYTLTGNELRVVFEATTDKPTVFNPTSHMYFNLAGGGTVEDHLLRITSDTVLALDKRWLPTGKFLPTEGTKLDFRKDVRLGDRFVDPRPPAAFDHTYVLENKGEAPLAAQLVDPKSGRSLKIFTDQPGLQFYPANSLRDVPGKGGVAYQRYAGVCLEPQHYPDSPNQSHFPTTTLRPGETYRSETIYEFGIQ